MSHWTVKAHDLRSAQAQLMLDLARTAEPEHQIRIARGATPAGDEHRLRGIPVQARGVGGAIRNTRPGDTLR